MNTESRDEREAPNQVEKETMNEKDQPQIDWQQVVLNGGPPCFYVYPAEGRYCGRAERWAGHGHVDGHGYVSLDDLINNIRKETQRAVLRTGRFVLMGLASTNANPLFRSGFTAGINASIQALEAADSTQQDNEPIDAPKA